MIALVLILAAIYLLLLRGRVGHPKLKELKKWSYAHRGLHDDTLPENSMGAFRKATEAGYGMELDVHLLADGQLAVIHDSSLKRTAGVDKKIEDMRMKNEALNRAFDRYGEAISKNFFKYNLDLNGI